jgi:predicted oxidoreductase (fatty acid repression mutant protein)
MTLREAIKVNKGKNIRVGAATAFIYINKCTRSTPNTLERLSVKEYERLKDLIDANIAHISDFNNIWDKITRDRLKKIIIYKKIDKIQAYIDEELKETERNKKKDYEQTKKSIKEYKERFNNFVPYLDREVIKMYQSDINDDVIIIIQGIEAGESWDEQEYKRKKGANK